MHWADGNESLLDDPYRFGPVLGEMDVWLLGEGSHLRPFEILGAHLRSMSGVAGTSFAVWAPNASRVSVVGDFNVWDGRRHPMRLRRECGVWEIFVPGIAAGTRYKFEVRTRDGVVMPLKADPYAFRAELRPATASVVGTIADTAPASAARQRANALDAPMSIYEVHLGSWRRKPEEGNRFLNWEELADTLIPYAQAMGFTHLELLPVSEHPFDGSWGYQPVGLVRADRALRRATRPAPLRRPRATPPGWACCSTGCRRTSRATRMAWRTFDGTQLYEYADPREGFHNDWDTLIYNFGRTEVRNFLVGNALFWLERYDVDGLRVDAVASMLYRDYSREAGEWIPNVHGGRENLEAIAFLKRMNEVVGVERAQAVTLAEESTAFPAVSRPTYAGGLGLPLQVEHGLDARHAGLHAARPDPPPVPPRRADLRPGLCVQRELRAAAVARRSGARQGLAARQDAGRPLAAVRQPARLLRLHVRPPGQEAAVHGRRVRAGSRMGPRHGASTGTCSPIRCTMACSARARPEPTSTAAPRRCTSRTSSRRVSSGSTTATPSARC